MGACVRSAHGRKADRGTEAALGDLMRSRRVTVGAMARASTVESMLCVLTAGARIYRRARLSPRI